MCGGTGRRCWRVVITGLGAVSNVGLDVQSMWDSLVRGQSGIGPITAFEQGPEWTVQTAHLESLREGAGLRERQLSYVVERLTSAHGPAVFAGDTNLRDAEAARVDGHEPAAALA